MSALNRPTTPKKTLGITGITIHAMALMAPGAFAWLLYQSQMAAGGQGVFLGVLAALGIAILTAFSLAELAKRYPVAGLRSAYHYAEQVFRQTGTSPARLRAAKFITAWAAHLYYWVYPGVMVGFIGILADYFLRQMGYAPKPLGQAILAVGFAAFIGFLALRGITGTTASSIVLNTVQLTTLAAFSLLAFAFRLLNPLALPPADWLHPEPAQVLQIPGFTALILQAGLAMMLMVGFESVTSLGGQAENPTKDIPRAGIFALVLQGIFAYLLIYLATELALNLRLSPAQSPAPLGALALQIGDSLLQGNGFALMAVLAFTVFLALLAALLTSTNNAVRISFAMSLDEDMPDLLGVFSSRYATPRFAVFAVSTLSAVLGAAAILGGLPALIGLILTANSGAFFLYALLCLMAFWAYRGAKDFHPLRHFFLPLLGFAANLWMAFASPLLAYLSGGILARAALLTLGMAALWLLLTAAYALLRRRVP